MQSTVVYIVLLCCAVAGALSLAVLALFAVWAWLQVWRARRWLDGVRRA